MFDAQQPELTWGEAEAVVDVFLHCSLQALGDFVDLRAQLAARLQAHSPVVRHRVLSAFDLRIKSYARKAEKIAL